MSTETHTYTGSCHCKSITYTLTFPMALTSTKVTMCNCTLCTKNGYLNIYPLKKDIVIKGEEHLKGYTWSETSCVHLFCTGCGSSMFAQPRDREGPDDLAINVSQTIKG